MTAVTSSGAAIITSVTTLLSNLFGFIPSLIGAIILIIIGWIIAGIVYRVVAAVLRKLRVDELAERHGIAAFLQRANVTLDAAGVIADIAKWYIRLIFLEAAFNALGLPQVVAIINSIILFLPNLVVALLLLFVGTLVARFVRSIVKASAQGASMGGADTIGALCFFGIMAFFFIAAVGQIGIATGYLNILFSATVGGLALALALAFGLGGRDAAARAIDSMAGAVAPPASGAVPAGRREPLPPSGRPVPNAMLHPYRPRPAPLPGVTSMRPSLFRVPALPNRLGQCRHRWPEASRAGHHRWERLMERDATTADRPLSERPRLAAGWQQRPDTHPPVAR